MTASCGVRLCLAATMAHTDLTARVTPGGIWRDVVKRSVKHFPARLSDSSLLAREERMPRFVIEREIPRIGEASQVELKAISEKSCGVLRELGPEVRWVQSYVTGDKMYCVYNSASEDLVRDHARRGGFPADSVARVMTVIDPTTAEG